MSVSLEVVKISFEIKRQKKLKDLKVIDNIYETYCVKQRKVTACVPGSKKIVTTKNGRKMMKCKCAECGATKT